MWWRWCWDGFLQTFCGCWDLFQHPLQSTRNSSSFVGCDSRSQYSWPPQIRQIMTVSSANLSTSRTRCWLPESSVFNQSEAGRSCGAVCHKVGKHCWSKDTFLVLTIYYITSPQPHMLRLVGVLCHRKWDCSYPYIFGFVAAQQLQVVVRAWQQNMQKNLIKYLCKWKKRKLNLIYR